MNDDLLIEGGRMSAASGNSNRIESFNDLHFVSLLMLFAIQSFCLIFYESFFLVCSAWRIHLSTTWRLSERPSTITHASLLADLLYGGYFAVEIFIH
jgi:hypothetical protein